MHNEPPPRYLACVCLGAHIYVQRGRWREGREGGKEEGRAYEKEGVCVR